MAKIAVLPAALASQIAAGEVVERPASALKELIENALDAGATRCDVEIEGGGITRLSVRDDGGGMSPEDAALSVERHSTSKLRNIDDLSNIGSYGFRGEALPSIASVSRFTLETRARESEVGTRVSVEGGGNVQLSEVGMPVGTRVQFTDLFFNIPARRKFLKSSGTEAGHIADVLEAAALSAPTVTFTLQRDGRKAREWLRAADRSSRVALLFDGEPFVHCTGERGPLQIEAFLGRPEQARLGAGGLKLFCNQRPVRDRAVLTTLAQAYGSVLERGRYPRGVVYLQLPPQLVDINVHPQKSEVRFADGRAVTDAIYDVISRQLASAFSLPASARSRWSRPPTPSVTPEAADTFGEGAFKLAASDVAEPARSGAHLAPPSTPLPDAAEAGTEVYSAASIAPPSSWLQNDAPPATSAPTHLSPHREKQQSFLRIHEAVEATRETVTSDAPPSDASRGKLAGWSGALTQAGTEGDVAWRSLRFVAQVRATYLLCEGDDGLYVLDQHAAAERVNFHRLKQEYDARQMASQALLFPVAISVTAEQSELISEHEPDIQRLGFDVRVHGENSVSVHRVPRLLQRDSTERLFRDLLSELSRSGRGYSAAVEAALSTIACHGSVRAGDSLDEPQASALLRSLDGVDFASHCPHGRPIVAFTSWSELERKVGRR